MFSVLLQYSTGSMRLGYKLFRRNSGVKDYTFYIACMFHTCNPTNYLTIRLCLQVYWYATITVLIPLLVDY